MLSSNDNSDTNLLKKASVAPSNYENVRYRDDEDYLSARRERYRHIESEEDDRMQR